MTAGPGRAQELKPVESLFDPKLAEVRLAAGTWNAREPERTVLDQVCLVPDLPTFLDAIAAWDGRRFFPILIEDGEYTPRFLRAFKPGRVVRMPRRSAPVPPDRLWEAALEAVGKAWTDDDAKAPAGSSPPHDAKIGPTPPGVVLSQPESPSIAGAVALAAGRFQPLLRWDPAKRFGDMLSHDEAETLAGQIDVIVGGVAPEHRKLGDDCDFITLALDYPYRYNGPDPGIPGLGGGPAALDDLIGRGDPIADVPGKPRLRWSYNGRLLGDPITSVYRAMGSLFLQPSSALLFNGYSDKGDFAAYTQKPAEARLKPLFPVALHEGGDQGTIMAWHRAFGIANRAGFLMINTSGSPDQFNLIGPGGRTGDVPMTAPTAMHIIHSFSAQDPRNPGTLAGRWLANGAYWYLGSCHEPYLQSFRHPVTIAALTAERLPLSVACRMTPQEFVPFGNPWRLVVLGDPLARIEKPGKREAASAFAATRDWTVYKPEPPPPANAPAAARLGWAARASAIASLPSAAKNATQGQAAVLLSIHRDQLDKDLLPLYDALLTDALVQANRLPDLRARLTQIPAAERSADVKRWLESVCVTDVHRGLETNKWKDALAAWTDLVRSDSPKELKSLVTARIGSLATDAIRATAWAATLRGALRGLDPETTGMVETELNRIRETPQLKNAPPPRRG